MGVIDILKRACIKTIQTLKQDRAVIELISGNVMNGVGAYLFVKSADDIAEVNQMVRDNKEELSVIDNDPSGWSEMDETRNHYIFRTTAEAAKGYVKSTWLPVSCIVVGTGLCDISAATLGNQVAQLTTVATSLATAFTTYRQRVVSDQGEAKDLEYLTGAKVEEKEVVNEDGTIDKVLEATDISGVDQNDVFGGFMFDEAHNANFVKGNCEHTLNWLFGGINAIDIRLQQDGQMTLNEMLDCFGADPTVEGQIGGAFLYDKNSNKRTVRLNPAFLEAVNNGERADCFCLLEYAPLDGHGPGEPLDRNILTDKRNTWHLHGDRIEN